MGREDEVKKTAAGEAYDPETGEVLPASADPSPKRELSVDPVAGEVTRDDDAVAPPRRGPWGRPMRTPEEQAEAKRVREERDELRRAEVAALRAVDPACEIEGDPPVVWRKPARMGGEPSGVLLDLPRASGRGKPGSRLVLAARSYDGAGPNGGHAHDYATGFVIFRDGAGYPRRTVGVAIHRVELRAAAAALLAYADELDARDGDAA